MIMFTWNIAKSAEAVFTRWAVKRLCKFVLKKKLGQFILGEIDLDQLDVQLGQGTIQLTDLALNVDYLNTKLARAASLMIKEGSVGALSVRMPWKGKGFEVEVDEMELVLSLGSKNNLLAGDVGASGNNCSISKESESRACGEVGRLKEDASVKSSSAADGDVHEGVKTIAKMVKWFLTSFHVKVKNLIVAFEPYLEKDGKMGKCEKTLVFRISETECGTCVLDNENSGSGAGVENFLGISRLTNIVKFQGAVLELLEMDGVDYQACPPCALGSSFSEVFSGQHPPNASPIMKGKNGGFSGNLKLGIPWKNGSLDISKVDADVFIDPVELRLQPSTIKWLQHSWDAYKSMEKDGRSNMLYKTTDSVYFNSASHFHPSTSVHAMFPTDKMIPSRGSFSSTCSSVTGHKSVSEVALPGSHFIPNWVPNSVKENENDHIQEELDLGASVDQFFECLDGLRNSQSTLGSSGMWNWTCSVLSALTAASSLASGSFHIPSEQQHVQTNFKATLVGISVMLSFQDEDQEHLYDPKDGPCFGSNVHYLGAECREMFVVLQVCPQEMRFDGTVKYIEVADYTCNEDIKNLYVGGNSNYANCQTLLIQRLQDEVQGALPHFVLSTKDADTEDVTVLAVPDFPFQNLTKIKLLSTSGTTHCLFTVNSDSLDGSLIGATSFSLRLPPFVLWVNFWSINMMLDLLKDVTKSLELKNHTDALLSGCRKHGSSSDDMAKGLHSCGAILSSKQNLRGNILIPSARVILCFPFGSVKDFGGSSPWDEFISIDFSSPSNLGKGKERASSTLDASSPRSYTSRGTSILHLDVGNINIYMVNSLCENNVGLNSCGMPRQKFRAQKILSVSNKAGCLSTVSMVWQEGPVAGPWIAERAKSLATSEDSGGRKKFTVKGYEFATVTAVEDIEDVNFHTREEIILSSSFFLHFHLFPVAIDLGSSQYHALHRLLKEIINELPGVACNAVTDVEVSSVSQTSILVECESLEILIRPDVKDDIKSSLQNELPGSWDCLKLRIGKFSMLSVSNIGGIKGSNFFWLAHGEGKLWGSITGVLDQEFLLISCSNSTRKRGDGEGSNALSSRLAGSNIVHLWDPICFHNFTSITLACDTIIAVGGRLDWLNVISSFFILPSPEVEKVGADNLPKEDLDAASQSSFILELVDVGLSYEPYLKNTVARNLPFESTSSPFKEETDEPYVACLLAASSLTFSNSTMEDCIDSDFKIRVQDLGLLLCAVNKNVGGTYSVEYLHEMGYVKVAQEALVEAILRTNHKNGLLWEVECSKSHIFMETCHDTTSGLMRLAAQLQQLFAPDLEESVVHLQNRWNNVHQAQERNEFDDESRTSIDDSCSPASQVHVSCLDRTSKVGVLGLMDEICEDAFHLDGNQVRQFDANESQVHVSLDESLIGDACYLSMETPDLFSDDISFDQSVPIVGLETSQTSFLQNGAFTEFIEGYCLSDLRPLSELAISRQSPPGILKLKSENFGDGGIGRGKSGWYEDASLSVVENHIPGASGESIMNQFLEEKLPCTDSTKSVDFENVTGRVLCKNINVTWRMCSGSDWHLHRKNHKPFANNCGRDTSACLELALSGIQFQHDFFPIGGICASKLTLTVQDFYLYDKSKTAPWKRVLGYYNSKDHPRESSSKAFKLDLEAVRPDPLIPLEEYRLRIACLPMLLHLHQSQLDFLITFFGPRASSIDPSSHYQNSVGARPSAMKCYNIAGHTIADEALLPYFQKFDIWPILIRVDYSPNHVDLAALRSGKYVELVNLVPWKGVELQLKHVHAVGVYGWGSVCETIIGEWLEEVSQNQMHKILRGLPTIQSLIAVVAGAGKLVSLPVESYRKDQRILKGMQRGTIAFLRSISLEAVGLGVHLAAGAHDILLQAEHILTSISPLSRPVKGKMKPNVRCNQPKDAQQGIQQAYESLSDGVGKSASAIVRAPLNKYRRGASAGSALATAVRAVPAAAIAPVSACASAAHYALLGIRNSLDPERKKESMEKYLGPTHLHDSD